MNRRAFCSISCSALMLLVGGPVLSASMCIETGPGGALTQGTLSQGMLDSLLVELDKAPSNAALFIVQDDDGYYAKVCNTPDQIEHFEREHHPKKWRGGEKLSKGDILRMLSQHHVIRVNNAADGLRLFY